MIYGLTLAGFVRQTAESIKEELQAAFEAQDFDSTGEFEDMLISILTERESKLWELAEAVYYSAFPDYAEGNNLDNACGIVAVARYLALYSTVELTLINNTVNPAVVPAGSIARQGTTLVNWITLTDVTIPASGTVTVFARSEEKGEYTAPINTVNEIMTPISGWDEVDNLTAATIGRSQETDAELRLKRQTEIVTSKGGILAAMVERVKNEIAGVTYCTGRQNNLKTTDANGLPGNSYELIIEGGDDQEIADLIAKIGPPGIESHGDTSATGADSMGNSYTIKFSRLTQVQIYYTANLTVNSSYPADGDTLARAAVAAFGAEFVRDQDVYHWQMDTPLKPIPGITAVTVYIGTSPAPSGTANIAIGATQRAVFDPANITINS